MLNENDLHRFMRLRLKVFDAIRKSLDEDGHCKSYEGAFQIHFPNYFESISPEGFNHGTWAVSLDCYLVGPSRHYQWDGKSFSDALDKAERAILSWLSPNATQEPCQHGKVPPCCGIRPDGQ